MTQNELFNILEEHYEKGLPFVVFKYPNTNKIKAILQKDYELYTAASFKETGFVFAPFNINNQPTVIIPYNASDIIDVDFDKNETNVSSNIKNHYSHKAKSQHLELVETGIAAIHENKFKKVVLSRCEQLPLQESNLITLYKRLLQTSNHFVYGFFHPKVGEWLGATPEVLLRIENNTLYTMALAGTKTADANWTAKEEDEQQVVTDFIVDSITPYVNTLKTSETETITAGNIQHLRTIITASSNSEINYKALIQQLHPTPAVCGLPKHNAMEFILQNEQYNREFYTGFLGELHVNNTTKLFVNLRCMQLKQNNALVYVGGGITKDSITEHEWDETVRKTQTMKDILV